MPNGQGTILLFEQEMGMFRHPLFLQNKNKRWADESNYKFHSSHKRRIENTSLIDPESLGHTQEMISQVKTILLCDTATS
jgi:hypothetical protein